MTGIIIAWDKNTYTGADRTLLHELLSEPNITIKLGYEAIFSLSDSGPSVADHVRNVCVTEGKSVMWDAKLPDISHALSGATAAILKRRGIKMLTVMASVSESALRTVAEACLKHDVTSLAVTIPTDIGPYECKSIYGKEPEEKVLELAERARRCGIGGIVCSPKELSAVRREFPDLITVVPGVRPPGADTNDQKRVGTPAEAAHNGANYIVVGRPVLNAPRPLKALRRIRRQMEHV